MGRIYATASAPSPPPTPRRPRRRFTPRKQATSFSNRNPPPSSPLQPPANRHHNHPAAYAARQPTDERDWLVALLGVTRTVQERVVGAQFTGDHGGRRYDESALVAPARGNRGQRDGETMKEEERATCRGWLRTAWTGCRGIGSPSVGDCRTQDA
ncbi:hypothetical protein MAPG_04852 [Magnaporthiopsis poae ATCC 64411]|uniref:Uncharacterized protein n=1 Tax=Magnaporthiopsis poae (strain ATCC 64411 / 73-15) TaxID=644358 RepID=A0A0C4DXU5_MAGP6|nr:hypothetical protein MAPG_04852 [Magnaporthiopsis poae ATCC 64411]